MFQKNENGVMKNWSLTEEPVVSICCVTYNHEEYIEDAINGFLMQETNFPFEIIIHDDASTDNTKNIIKSYAKEYPHIIKTILQEENQYSQGQAIMPLLFEKAKGNYYALSDCDDYWIVSNKLQIQIDLMKENTECYMSFHSAEQRSGHDKFGKIISKQANANKIFSTSEVILGEGNFCPTASLIIHKESVSRLPGFFNDVTVGDYFFQILGSLNGGALYIDKVMSVYRQDISDSWSLRMKNITQQEEFYFKHIEALDKMNLYLDKKYQEEIDRMKSKSHYEMSLGYFDNKMYKQFQDTVKCSFNLYKINSLSYSLFYYLRYFPFLINFLKKLKGID